MPADDNTENLERFICKNNRRETRIDIGLLEVDDLPCDEFQDGEENVVIGIQ